MSVFQVCFLVSGGLFCIVYVGKSVYDIIKKVKSRKKSAEKIEKEVSVDE